MRRFLILLIASGAALCVAATCRIATPPTGRTRVTAADRVRPGQVRALYAAWSERRRAEGRAERLVIRLGFAKGLSEQPIAATGTARIDRATGRVRVELVGAGFDRPLAAWLVDNRPGGARGALPGEGDAWIALGSLVRNETGARLAAELRPDDLDGFEIDGVVIADESRGPVEGGVLFGAPGAFERLYRAAGASPDWSELDRRVARGADLFENEIFDGNGRTCATCHPAANNFTIDPAFIATLPADDPLFVAERVPALAGLENARLLRSRGLVLENLDGFDRPGVLRGVPHVLALPTSIRGPEIPFDNTANPAFGIAPPAERTGWSGDGAPGSGSLRDFAIGAVVQHFPRTLERVEGRDFRLPNDEELDALELFQLSLGRAADLDLDALRFLSPVAEEGRTIFGRLDSAGGTLPAGKCGVCHSQAGANIDAAFFAGILGTPVSGNANFGTAVNELDALPAALIDPGGAPRDGGFARVAHDGVSCTPALGGFGTVTPEGGALPPGLCEEDFNTPPLIEAADTAPFFHNNAVDTLEAAVAFYNDDAFNDSAGGRFLASLDTGGIGIRLDSSQVSAVAAFLRVLNAVENIATATQLIEQAIQCRGVRARSLLEQTREELFDAIRVLESVSLGAEAVEQLRRADARIVRALSRHHRHRREWLLHAALQHLARAKGGLVIESVSS